MSFNIVLLPEFDTWLSSIKDGLTRRRLVRRLERAEQGASGDVASVGEGVSEHFGPGWRMYFVQRGELMIVMLGGGNKSTQQRDINQAIILSKTLED